MIVRIGEGGLWFVVVLFVEGLVYLIRVLSSIWKFLLGVYDVLFISSCMVLFMMFFVLFFVLVSLLRKVRWFFLESIG